MKNFFIFFVLIFFSFKIQANDNEIEILIDIPGTGIKIDNHYKIKVHYSGSLLDGKEFDSSFKRNKPFEFQIGLRQVIPGWELGIIGMKVGGKRKIKIPPLLAYGSKGAGNVIPPNATLIFDIEIITAEPPGYNIIKSRELVKKQKKGFLVIDIRTEAERKTTGIIKDSIEMTAFDINGNFQKDFFDNYKKIANNNDHVIFVSNKGDISSILANGFVEKLGALHMYSLQGGIDNWINEGRYLSKN
tara:strand:+ start:793 stop:1527 length:735 start_codon:yes stop_codon:yes gene_type:complete